jgi:fido (protein-threonine AMPylation protein)
MHRRSKRPKTNIELEDREAAGLWKAIALANRLGEEKEKITLQIILDIHRTMVDFAYLDIAGRFRKTGEDIKKLKCMEPPPGRLVEGRMYQFWRGLDMRLARMQRFPKEQTKTQRKKWFAEVIEIAAWVQHEITAIHPFCGGNGRMARLMTNLILKKFGLPGSRVKYEGEHKAHYLDALCQIDHHGDFEPLQKLIARSVFEAMEKEKKWRSVQGK